MEKNRLEAFSDGVLAIIITIMILELKQPAGSGLKDFIALWPTLIAYLISFMFIAIYWVNHHLIFHLADRINVGILWCNIVWLFVMSFIPFTTEWVGSFPSSWAPLAVYFADMAAASIAFHLMYYLILRENGQKFRLGASQYCKSYNLFFGSLPRRGLPYRGVYRSCCGFRVVDSTKEARKNKIEE